MTNMGDGHSDVDLVDLTELTNDGFVMLNGRPCRIIGISRPAWRFRTIIKTRFRVIDIFTGEKFEGTSNTTKETEVPRVSYEDYQLIDIDDGFLTLMADNADTRCDIKIPHGDLGAQLKAGFDNGEELICTVLKFRDEECVVAIKPSTELDK